MPARLLACPSCARHVRADEEHCPFCHGALPDDFGAGSLPVPPPPGLSRGGLARYGALRIMASGMLASALASTEAVSAGCSSHATYGGADAGCEPNCDGGTEGEAPETDDARQPDAPPDASDGG
jgi:hypothetical protein